MPTREPVKTPFILALNADNKNELGDPHFLLLENNQHTMIELSAKFKKFVGADSVPP